MTQKEMVLSALRQGEGTSTEIGKRCSMKSSTASAVLSLLQKDGAVRKVRTIITARGYKANLWRLSFIKRYNISQSTLESLSKVGRFHKS